MGDIFKRLINVARSEISHFKNPDRELSEEFLEFFRQRPGYDNYRDAFEEEYRRQTGDDFHRSSDQTRQNTQQENLGFDPYATLEVPHGASWEVIDKAYKKMARKYHPDRYQSDKEQELATKIMSGINASYEFLKKKHGQR